MLCIFALISCWRIYDVPAFTLFDYSCSDFFERYRYYSSHRSDTERLSAVMTDSLNRGDIEGLKNALKADGGIRPGSFYLQSMYMELKHIRRQLLKALQHMRQVF